MKRKNINKTPIIDVIVKQMKERGMTQVELSELIGCSTPCMCDMLAARREIDPAKIVSISLVLGLDAIELGRMKSDYEIMQIIKPIIKSTKE